MIDDSCPGAYFLTDFISFLFPSLENLLSAGSLLLSLRFGPRVRYEASARPPGNLVLTNFFFPYAL